MSEYIKKNKKRIERQKKTELLTKHRRLDCPHNWQQNKNFPFLLKGEVHPKINSDMNQEAALLMSDRNEDKAGRDISKFCSMDRIVIGLN